MDHGFSFLLYTKYMKINRFWNLLVDTRYSFTVLMYFVNCQQMTKSCLWLNHRNIIWQTATTPETKQNQNAPYKPDGVATKTLPYHQEIAGQENTNPASSHSLSISVSPLILHCLWGRPLSDGDKMWHDAGLTARRCSLHLSFRWNLRARMTVLQLARGPS